MHRSRHLLSITLTLLLSLVMVMAVSADNQPPNPTTSTQSDDPPFVQFPRYHVYTPPATLGQSAGEPTLGVNWNTNATMYIAVLETLRVHFDDDYSQDLIDDPEIDHRICSSPVKEVWVDKSYDLHLQTLDPILYTDPLTGRTFSSQLNAKTSLLGLSDDDGDTWMPSEGGSFLTSGVDHQTIASGPYPPSFPIQGTIYPHAVYYCGQDVAYANCARSDDGGMTFGPASPMYTIVQCGGLHGHVQVEPLYTDGEGAEQGGTVYVPNKSCGGNAAVIVSENAGTTWTVRQVPDSTGPTGLNDPSVGIGAEGTLYLGYADSNRVPSVAVSSDKGATWDYVNPVSTNITPTIQTAVFTTMIAGDDDRAAMAFFGTSTPNAFDEATSIDTEWHLYVSHTYDRGQTWHAINVTPNDPIQRGRICTDGTACNANRNLLDFFDIKIDREGRTLIGFDDGCVGSCVDAPPNSGTALGSIARQEGGRGLFAEFDGTMDATVPAAPRVDSAEIDALGTVTLDWTLADDGGSAVQGFNVYRKVGAAGTFALLNDDGLVTETTFEDFSADATADNFYKITAVNAVGEGAHCLEFLAKPEGEGEDVGNRCERSGLRVLLDAEGDSTSLRSDTDFISLTIAEPFEDFGPPEKLVFNMQVGELLTVAPSTTYYALFHFEEQGYFLSATGLAEIDTGTEVAQFGTYEYGTFTYNSNDNFITTEALGSLDGGGFSTSSDTIGMIIDRNKLNLTGNVPEAGTTLAMVDARIIAVTTDVISTLFEDRPGVTSNYAVAGNLSCAPNEAPTPLINVDPIEGQSPLDVMIDATESFDVDESDTIAEYRFDLGDGTAPIIQTTPILTHTYSHTESETVEYRITVTVRDSRGKASITPAAQVIEVLPSNVPTALTTAQLDASGSQAGVWLGVGVIALLTVAAIGTVSRLRRNG